MNRNTFTYKHMYDDNDDVDDDYGHFETNLVANFL